MRSRKCCVLRVLILLVFVGSSGLSRAQALDQVPSDTETYYRFRADLSRCHKSPCRGGFVKLVNHMATPCIKGGYQHECYVADVDYASLSLSDAEYAKLLLAAEAGHVLFEGRIKLRGTSETRAQRYFEVSQAWIAASGKPATGTYYQVTNSNINCPSHPCPAYYEVELNDVWRRYIDDVKLTLSGASEQQIEDAYDAMARPQGVIVAGAHTTRLGTHGKELVLVGSQFYLRVAPNPCQPTGCAGQICAATAVVTTCEWRPEYACYRTAICEQQADGQCRWTKTPELLTCLDKARQR